MPQGKDQFVHSANLNLHTDFPYLALEVIGSYSYPQNPGFHVMHWHEDLQLIYVADGKIEVKTLAGTVYAEKGDGIFINKNVVHFVNQTVKSHYHSFIFPDYFLAFFPGSPAGKFVRGITEQAAFAVFRFSHDEGWCGEILSLMQELASLEGNKPEYYEYEVLVRLSSAFLAMLKNVPLPSGLKESAAAVRMRKLLQYLELHYAEDIALKDMAGSANISISECLRCFRQCLQTTPHQYLLEYRLSKAAAYLSASDEPVGQIAEKTGFHQASHFGKCFREKTGYSPREYRKKERQHNGATGSNWQDR